MRYLVLCTDYDGTLATEGHVFPETAAAVEKLIASGRRVVLVTGRELDELKSVCPYLNLFEYVVAENGALLYHPSTDQETTLAQRPPDSFVAALRARGVGPISVGRAIVATWEPHETAVLETIKEQGLELQVIFNKGAVMILPAGVNKASGLSAALKRMGLSPHNAVGVGDAENDHALLALCEFGVAVDNALPTLKQQADLVTRGARGAGVMELIESLLADDLAAREPVARRQILLGVDAREQEFRIRPYGENILLSGDSGVHPVAEALLEAIRHGGYSVLLVGEGRYEASAGAVALGTLDRAPGVEEVLKLLRDPQESGAVNLSALPAHQRRGFQSELLARLEEMRARTGRPHWLVIDTGQSLTAALPGVLQITRRPQELDRAALAAVNLVLATGDSPERIFEEFGQMTGIAAPRLQPVGLQAGEAVAWRPREGTTAPSRLRIKPRSR